MITAKMSVTPGTNWKAQKDKLKIQFPQLKETDLNFDESKKKEMFDLLSSKLGRTNEELQVIIETL